MRESEESTYDQTDHDGLSCLHTGRADRVGDIEDVESLTILTDVDGLD
jgi:hypothetical protein